MARETSSHNSGVVHASIYYETGSLKHRLCWEGNPRIYEWAEAHAVPVRRTGKIIVALSEDERPGLDEVYRQAVANNVRGVERITGARARELEPHIPSLEAIWSPSTGVVASRVTPVRASKIRINVVSESTLFVYATQHPHGDHATCVIPPCSSLTSAVRHVPASTSTMSNAFRWFVTARSGASGDGAREIGRPRSAGGNPMRLRVVPYEATSGWS